VRSGGWGWRQSVPETGCHAPVCIELVGRRARHFLDQRSLVYCRSHCRFGLGRMILEIVMRQIKLSYAPLIERLPRCGRPIAPSPVALLLSMISDTRTASIALLSDAAERALRVAGPDGWIVTGGIPQVSQHLTDMLISHAPDRVLHNDSLDIHASKADLAEAARAGASKLRTRSVRAPLEASAQGRRVAGSSSFALTVHPAAGSRSQEKSYCP